MNLTVDKVALKNASKLTLGSHRLDFRTLRVEARDALEL